MDVPALRATFAEIAPHADAVARAFYARLFGTWPQARALFRETDFAEQRRKLMASVAAVVGAVDRPDQLHPLLDELGRRHGALGIEARHYPWVSAALLGTLAGHFGPRWTPELASTWEEALHHVSDRMIAAAGAPAR